ncbi:MAG: GDP-mannose 4,6-dehydratase, partial [Clostridiales bacterium]|nr:GDP-mannose 4,6-dehydratase [Clostridiales bacterium]
MGQATLAQLHNAPHVSKIKLLCHSKKRMKKLLKKHKSLRPKIELVEGGMSDRTAVKRLIDGAAIIINMAAVIPPRSDQNPKGAIACNETGVKILVDEIERITENQPALVHVSTVAVYGNRSGAHPFARVGDPLLVSPLDVYSATKLRGEFCVLESAINKWAILRQSAMLHPQMLTDNIHDGLMFHTAFDSPLEWVTAHDSGVLIRNIIEKYADGTISERFWKRCHNIAGGAGNRNYGMTSFDDGFVIIGGKTTDYFRPGDNATRNFHGVWYLDGDELNDMFDFQSQTTDDYWQEVFRAHPVFKLGKAVPKRVIGYFMFRRLYKDKNAPHYWAKHRDEARLTAYFGGRENYEKLQRTKWQDFPVPDRNDIASRSDNETPVFYGFDFSKSDGELTTADLAAVATAHGGKLISEFDGDMYKKLEWITQDGERFSATAYTVLRAGHWYN